MKRLPMLLLVALMLTLSFAQAETPASTPAQTPVSTPAADLTAQETTIRATGTESVSLPADIVVLTLCVQGSGDTVTAAQDKAEQVMQSLRDALAQMGISEHDAQTAYYGVETVYNYQYSKLGQQETASGYTVSIDLAVRLDDPTRVGEVIDAAIRTGAQNSYELAYESSEARDAYFEALGAATADAMAQAILLAEASGLELGRVTEVQGDESTVMATSVSAETPVHPHLSVTATVEVCYTASHP